MTTIFLVLSFLTYFMAGSIVYWTLKSVRADISVTGTSLFPVYKWSSSRHNFTVLAVGAAFGSPIGGFLIWGVLGEPNLSSVLTVGGGALLLGLSVLLNVLWKRQEAKWEPEGQIASAGMYCVQCGHHVNAGHRLGGWCAACGAAPGKECDAKAHLRREQTGDDRSHKQRNRKKRKAVGARRKRG